MKCPNCGSSNLYATCTLDTEYWDNAYYDTVTGVCPECQKAWQWVEVFTFDHWEDIKETEI